MSELLRPVDEHALHFDPWGLGGAIAAEPSERLLHQEMDALVLGANRRAGKAKSAVALPTTL